MEMLHVYPKENFRSEFFVSRDASVILPVKRLVHFTAILDFLKQRKIRRQKVVHNLPFPCPLYQTWWFGIL